MASVSLISEQPSYVFYHYVKYRRVNKKSQRKMIMLVLISWWATQASEKISTGDKVHKKCQFLSI